MTTSTSDNIRRKPGALEAGKKAIQEHLQRRGESGYVAIDWRTHGYWVKREVAKPRKVFIIIPARDGIPLLTRCIDSVIKKTSYQDYDIVIVNNDSESGEAREYFARTRPPSPGLRGAVQLLRDEQLRGRIDRLTLASLFE